MESPFASEESESNLKGLPIFDERSNEELRRRKGRDRLIVRLVSIVFAIPFFIFVLNFVGLIPFRDVPLEMTVVFFSAATIFLGMGVFFLAQTFKEDYIIAYQNGIEIRRGLLSRVEYYIFESISKIWVDVRDNKGVPTDYMAFEHTVDTERKRRLLSKGLFVDVEGFLTSIQGQVEIESQPITLSEFWKRA